MNDLARLIVDVGFTGPVSGTYWHIGDPVRGRIGTASVGPDEFWTDVSEWVVSASTRRGATRSRGPVLRYDAGDATIVLRNEDRRFDPSNLDGPYVVAGLTQVEPMREVRIRAEWDGVTYGIWRGFADDWRVAYAGPTGSVVTLTCFDAFGQLTAVNREAVTPVGGGELSGARISRILDSAGWPATDRVIAVGDSTMQATDLDGNALAELQLTAESELGEVWPDAEGRVVFRNRKAVLTETRSSEVQATFGDTQLDTPAVSLTAFTHTLTAAGVEQQTLAAADDAGEVAVTVSVSQNTVSASTLVAAVLRSDGGTSHYRAQVAFETASALSLSLVRRVAGVDTTLATVATIPGFWVATVDVQILSQVEGRTLRAKAWVVGDEEPISWQVTATDDALASGQPGVWSMASVGSGNTFPMTVDVDAFSAGPVDGLPELPYADAEVAYDAPSITNRASITRVGGAAQVAEDVVSQAKYLVRAYKPPSDLLLESDGEALSYARWLVKQGAYPELRFSTLTLLPRGDARLWAQVLGREIGDRVKVLRRPPGGGVPIVRHVYVRGISHEYTRELQWRTVFALQAADRAEFWTIGHPERGRIGFAAIAF